MHVLMILKFWIINLSFSNFVILNDEKNSYLWMLVY